MITIDAKGQGSNARKDTSQKNFTKTSQHSVKPLILLNDKEFTGDLNSLDPNNIESITVIKSADKVAPYGPKGVNGVILINTKDYVKPTKTDSIQKTDEVIYVVDGVPMRKSQADTADVLIRKSLSQKEMKDKGISFEKSFDSLIVITTKVGAIRTYEKKLSSFNKEYRQYVEKQGDDRMCHYFIDDKSLNKDGRDFIIKLYEIPADKIQSVTVHSPRPVDSFIGLNVLITTKQ